MNKIRYISATDYIENEKRKDPELEKMMDEEMKKMRYAVAITELRESLGLTQEQFAKKINKPQSTVARIENGNANPTFKTLYEIGDAVGKNLKISFE
ncbi:helix-turn-helix transcriptional regulator [Companilactobacillus jidongensis]|uniref:helix-turn-helix transcriptional regulator n=1 Tax=Companilactobacillus jidongensis TaxID=2486006 RepID=UPI000F797DC0|nr:helix-turn-helix transcriptional regulator [Companilactobacillus jidongensis]